LSEHTPEPEEKPPISIWKRLSLGAAVFVVLIVALGLGQYYLQGSRARSEAARMEEELDAGDPNWRWDEMDAARPMPPEEGNSARVVMAAYRLLPGGAGALRGMEVVDKLPPPPELLEAARAQVLDGELSRLTPAIQMARKLADMPTGRHHLMMAKNPITTLLPDQQNTRAIASLLRYDTIDQAQKNNARQALRSAQAILNAARSLGDEPIMISQLIRLACVAVSAGMVERVLAQGEPPVKDLEALQALVEKEELHPTLLVALRGERANLHALYKGLADGSIESRDFFGSMRGGPGGDLDLGERFMSWRAPSMARREMPLMLRIMNKAISNARLPEHEQKDAERELDAELRGLRARGVMLTTMLIPAMVKFNDANRRKVATMRCLRVLVALERHRQAKGKFPEKVEELTPKILSAIPLDPFDGKPLRYRVAGGVALVYSVGPDGKDDGGNLDPENPMKPGTDMGFRLWDVKHRRQPATVPPPAAPEGGPPGPGAPAPPK
jgi:hypothetical protein